VSKQEADKERDGHVTSTNHSAPFAFLQNTIDKQQQLQLIG